VLFQLFLCCFLGLDVCRSLLVTHSSRRFSLVIWGLPQSRDSRTRPPRTRQGVWKAGTGRGYHEGDGRFCIGRLSRFYGRNTNASTTTAPIDPSHTLLYRRPTHCTTLIRYATLQVNVGVMGSSFRKRLFFVHQMSQSHIPLDKTNIKTKALLES
jgi:hypothetical protein